MAIWTRLKQELDDAGRVAQGALDEGRLRLEIHRARRRADKAAQVLGYAVYRAKQDGKDLEPETYTRLSAALTSAEAEVSRHESKLSEMSGKTKSAADTPPGAATPLPSEPTAATGEMENPSPS